MIIRATHKKGDAVCMISGNLNFSRFRREGKTTPRNTFLPRKSHTVWHRCIKVVIKITRMKKKWGVSGRRTIYSLSKIHLNKIGENKNSNKNACVKTGGIIKGGELGTICRVSSSRGVRKHNYCVFNLELRFFFQNK